MLLGIQNGRFEFGARLLFDEVNWHINLGERIGLVGFNGTGKSTLFKILTGEYSLSKGDVVKSKETTIGYVHQDLMHIEYQHTILELAMSAFEKIKQKEAEQKALEEQLATDSENETLLWQYAEVLQELQQLDAYQIHYKAEEILSGLGFKETDFSRPFTEFSGGWRMRVILAKMILQNPDVLLLDEPTNHLDLPSIEWLEKYLVGYKGSVVMVSHDKFFLNKMVNKIIEIYQQGLHFYNGNYDYFLTEKALRIELQQKSYENQQDFIRQQERFIERFKAKASKATLAKSVQKKLDRLELVSEAVIEVPNLKINFSIETTPGKIVFELHNITKKYPKTDIFDNATAQILRGDKIALIGANGVGKSTVLRIIGGNENFSGDRVPGHNVVFSFYAQHQVDSLHVEWTVFEELQRCGSKKNDQEIRTILGCFLFSGDDIDKKIKVLSGGEKARVALAKVMISSANFLILDEPTNHLDMHSVEILAQALKNYEGTYIIVSHDRYFISLTANKIWEIKDQKIKAFDGGYTEFVEWQKNVVLPKQPLPASKNNVMKPIDNKNTEPEKNNKSKRIEKLQQDMTSLEKNIFDEEQHLKELENHMCLPEIFQQKEVYLELEKKYLALEIKILTLKNKYNALFENLAELE